MSYREVSSIVAASKATPITPDDSTVFNDCTRALWVGGSGTIFVDFADGGTNVQIDNAYGVLPFQVTRVYATGCTATNIVALR